MLIFAQKTMDSPQLEAATSALHGAIAGLVLAVALAWLLGRRNLHGELCPVAVRTAGLAVSSVAW